MSDADPLGVERETLLNRLGGDQVRGWIADHASKYAEPNFLGRMLTRYELLKRIVNVHGSIIECGCKCGDGLLQWLWFSRLIEPLARRRMVYGFDTFEGLTGVTGKDGSKARDGDMPAGAKSGSTSDDVFSEIEKAVEFAHKRMVIVDIIEETRSIGFRHPWMQVQIVRGDFLQKGVAFVESTPHLVVALLYLDFDIYEPTKRAIELFLPVMPKGSVIAFDELDHPDWPGETLALQETIGIRNLRIERFPWEPSLGFAVLE